MDLIAFVESLGTQVVAWAATSTHPWPLLLLVAALCWGDGFFPPLPAGTVVSAMGAIAVSAGNTPLLLAIIVVAALFALGGDLTMTTIGRRIPLEGNSRFSRLARSIGARASAHWTPLLSTSRFIPVVRVAVFLAAGSQRVSYRRIVVLDGMAATIWALVYALAGSAGGVLTGRPLLAVVIGMVGGGIAGGVIALLARRFQER